MRKGRRKVAKENSLEGEGLGKREEEVGCQEEKEVDSDEWFINFSCMMNEVEAEVETDGYH